MKIVQLHSENIKRLKVVDITPQDNIVIISGKNEAGKSSILDSIDYALSGDRSLCQEPIRKGEEKAVVSLDLNEYKIKKIITNKTIRLEVTTKEGHAIKSPQTMLNDIIGKLTFDPLEFSNMEKSKQRDLLLKLANINFSELDTKRKKIYDERTIIHREGDQLKIKYDEFDQEELKNAPGSEIDIVELNRELSTIDIQYNNYTQTKKNLADKEQDRAELNSEIQRIEKDLTSKKQKLDIYDRDIKRLKEDVETTSIEEISNRKDELEKSIEFADTENALFKEKQEFQEIETKYNAKKNEYAQKTAAIEQIDKQKKTMIENAAMPIEGLSFNDEIVLYNNIPFSQLSSAQKLRVSVAMAMAMNPKLRVIMIRDGSLLDSNNMKIIEEMAKDKDYQIWCEVVSDDGKPGTIFIEEGEVKKANQAIGEVA